MPTLLVFLLFLVAIAALFVKFATTDGDFTLISKGHAKREEIEGRVVWITGASRGIGEILAGQFLNLGAKVILSARNVVELERVKTELITKHPSGRVEVLPLDLASGEEPLKEAVQKAESLFSGSGIDYMVHNAAFERPKTNALEETEEAIQATFNVNVLGTINLTRLLAPYMLKRGRGHFVVMSSAAGKCPAPGQAMYSASKHALNGYFHTLRSELCQKGIKVTIVCPGPIHTNKNAGSSSSGQSGSSEKRVPAKRCAELTIVAASHGLKEVWISYQPVLLVMYMVQYMPTVGYWLMDKGTCRKAEITRSTFRSGNSKNNAAAVFEQRFFFDNLANKYFKSICISLYSCSVVCLQGKSNPSACRRCGWGNELDLG